MVLQLMLFCSTMPGYLTLPFCRGDATLQMQVLAFAIPCLFRIGEFDIILLNGAVPVFSEFHVSYKLPIMNVLEAQKLMKNCIIYAMHLPAMW